ncbi:triose-phosphate isomerase family protein [Enterococcus sp. CWB-B31]|uniref:triose-phosphate isomerase family protein n=1 Tax=Enterococcus sp. CWB-B31 TaxID=2885159 RepID=UPI001E48418E|nr:triose-phosphate isomerase family protein [Enterococcus sp. CWB-B31]MCB5955273.1 triose-phosphate isomerase [Enterococcus sp. CWB-B31]
MRRPVVGISLKMYQNQIDDARDFAHAIVEEVGEKQEIEQFMCPGMGVLYPVAMILKDSEIGLGAQNISFAPNGAYTGEFSVESLKDMRGSYAEIGHIERRTLFCESDNMINQKVRLALAHDVIPVLCIGETEKTDDHQEVKAIIKKQLFLDLFQLENSQVEKVILAYEPAWAVGKTSAASAAYVHQIHSLIRECVAELFDKKTAENIRIIYGGSVSQENSERIVSDDNVDGVFVGRFGHQPKQYASIVKIVKKIKGV